MNIRIYQINLERDLNRVAFCSHDQLEKYQGSNEIDSKIYDKVYEGAVEASGLEDVYRVFNLEHPPEYRGRSLSVSDIVEVIDGGDAEPGFHFCDSFGFQKVDFHPETVRESNIDTIRVVMLEPGKPARIVDLDRSLEGMQKAVGGYIEAYYPFEEEVCIICNEEGKIIGLPLNRAIYNDEKEIIDVIAGTAFICSVGEEHFESLTPEQAQKYRKQFLHPEVFVRTSQGIKAIPIEPKVKEPER